MFQRTLCTLGQVRRTSSRSSEPRKPVAPVSSTTRPSRAVDRFKPPPAPDTKHRIPASPSGGVWIVTDWCRKRQELRGQVQAQEHGAKVRVRQVSAYLFLRLL